VKPFTVRAAQGQAPDAGVSDADGPSGDDR